MMTVSSLELHSTREIKDVLSDLPLPGVVAALALENIERPDEVRDGDLGNLSTFKFDPNTAVS